MIVGRIFFEDTVPIGKMLGITVRMRMVQLRNMVKNIDSEFRCLEERSHRGEMVNKSKIVEVKMKLNIVEMLL